jgi:ABC-type transporter Mla MlaB component
MEPEKDEDLPYKIEYDAGNATLKVLVAALDCFTAPKLRPAFNELVEACPEFVTSLTVNLAGVKLIDASGLGALVLLYKNLCRKARRRIAFDIVEVEGWPYTILMVLRYVTIWRVCAAR